MIKRRFESLLALRGLSIKEVVLEFMAAFVEFEGKAQLVSLERHKDD
jgi:hypothetical protein